MYVTKFTVVGGKLPFPIDMLRNDVACPLVAEDVDLIEQTMTPEGRNGSTNDLRVTLVHRGTRSYWRPLSERWESFGWRVDLDSIEVTRIDSR